MPALDCVARKAEIGLAEYEIGSNEVIAIISSEDTRQMRSVALT